jgi:regulator of RNase E activity RraB
MRKSSSIFLIFIQLFSFFGPASVFAASNIASNETKEERAARIHNDRDVLNSLANSGSNLKKLHEIEFHFVSYYKAKITAVAEEGKKMGYRISKIDALNDKQARKYWYFDLIRSVVPSEKNIFSHTEIMTNLAKKHAVEFDGWGCLIVK